MALPWRISVESLSPLRAWLDVRSQPRLECIDRRLWFARTFGKLLKAPGELQRLADELPAIHPKKGIERCESGALIPIAKRLRM
jgi:hypothetical protein